MHNLLASSSRRPHQGKAGGVGASHLVGSHYRWPLTLALTVAWQLVAAQLPQVAPRAAAPVQVTISGVVLDDSLNVPVPGLWLYLNHTKYGAITNAQGEFAVTFPTGWKPVRGGTLLVQAMPNPVVFKPLQVPLDWRRYDSAQPLVLRLASAPGRGNPNRVGIVRMAPPVPPPTYPARAHTARPY